MRQHDTRDVTHGDRSPALALYHDRLHVLGTANVADSSNRELLLSVLKKAATDIAVRPAQRLVDVGERETMREQT